MNILVYSKSHEEPKQHLRHSLESLRREHLFGKLEHMLNKDEISIEPKKLEADVNRSKLSNILKICGFLGFAAITGDL